MSVVLKDTRHLEVMLRCAEHLLKAAEKSGSMTRAWSRTTRALLAEIQEKVRPARCLAGDPPQINNMA